MKIEEIIKLLLKERAYEKQAFGDYADLKCLNPANFLIMIQKYIEDMSEAYQEPWESKEQFPKWLLSCYESEHVNSGPVKFYESIVKMTALGLAVLETYADIDPEKWRESPEKDIEKWKVQNQEKGVCKNE